ncbi:ABC-type nitrate/sulfonate/bicarbonate transport system substrate-binding protein [Bradyrhizobium ottawaense]
MSINSHDHSITRRLAASLFAAAITLSATAASFAADTVVLRVGDQKGGNRSLLEISGYAKDLPYRIEWSEFPAAAPILEALNAGALDVGYTGDLSFLSVYAAGAPIKAIGGAPGRMRRRKPSWCVRTRRSNRPPTLGVNASPARAAAGVSS